MWKWILLVMIASISVSGCLPAAGGASGQTSQPPGDIFAGLPKIGQKAPNASVVGLDGVPLKISDFRGKPLIINFWATWCPPCRAEIPELDAVYKAHKDKGLEILGIDYGEDASAVEAFLKDMEVSYKIVVDPYEEAADGYRVSALPTSFFVDAEGVIQAVHLGGMDRRAIEEKLGKILAGR